MIQRFSKVCSMILAVTVSILVLKAPAFAYIDPGTGATFVGSMAPLLVGVLTGAFAFVVKVFWHPIKRVFSKQKPDNIDS